MENPKVLVLVLNWNKSNHTNKCVASFEANNYENFEIIVVDNNSEKSDYDQLTKKHKIIRLGENLGFSGGFNQAISVIKNIHSYDYLLLSNNDILANPDCIESLVSVADSEHNDIIIPVQYFSKTNRISLSGMRSMIPSIFQFVGRGKRKSNKVGDSVSRFLPGAIFMVPTEIFVKLKGLDEKIFMYGEDVDFGERARIEFGSRTLVSGNAKVVHESGGSTQKFSPLSRYYISRNIPRLIMKYSRHKTLSLVVFCFHQMVFVLI